MSRALLVLTSPLSQVTTRFTRHLREIQASDSKVLYVHFLKNSEGNWSKIITNLYQQCSTLDLRILLQTSSLQFIPKPIDKVYFENIAHDVKESYLKNLKEYDQVFDLKEDSTLEKVEEDKNDFKVVDNVCLGGTFDRIHNGHKILLSQAALRCQNQLTVGVTDESMLKSKKLKDLIEPVDHRVKIVKKFLEEIRGLPSQDFVTPIHDPFGPAITDKSLKLIVGSDETKRGCEKINEIRKEKNFDPLEIHLIQLVDDSCHELEFLEERKISSSNTRIRLLGEELKPPLKPFKSGGKPYIIGLTGGSASGKSNIAKYLADLGAGIVDCDKLGHKAYEPGTDCYHSLIKEFGEDLKSENGQIDRRKLGAKVFSDKDSLRKLESIVWPEILKMAKDETEKFSETKKVVVLDAAVLLQAGWDKDVHQIWGAFIDKEEAIIRIVERDGKTPEQAEARLNNQMSNSELISKCNSVFYTKWEYSVTRKQVDKAWNRLQNMLS